MKKLLNIDGGGVRVYFPLLILDYIEKKTSKKIIDLFDYYSGVSASSIILSALLTDFTVRESIKIFKDMAPKIFYKSYWYSIKSGFGLINSKYPDYYVNNEFQNVFQNQKFSNVKKPLSILTYDLFNSKPKCFHSYKDDNHHEIWQIIRGSSAAPTYFPAFKLENYILIDGGTVANNLSELIFYNALCYFGDEEDYYQGILRKL